ncbi:hypothetical protein, partial [Streptomyces sp. NPDC005507]|uniref:hypothetical protein n=1 Tax=unclassified Streptomyces TaxID=2593676 RepID=UPI0033B007C4
MAPALKVIQNQDSTAADIDGGRDGSWGKWWAELGCKVPSSVSLLSSGLFGWRRVQALSQRTRIDWAGQIKQLLSVDYPDA